MFPPGITGKVNSRKYPVQEKDVNSMQTLFPGVHLIDGEVDDRPLRLPLLVGASGGMLIDTGTDNVARKVVLPAVEEVLGGLDRLRWIVTTQSDLDHQGGNSAVKAAAPGALLACGTADRELVENPDRLMEERYDAFRADHGVAYPDGVLEKMRRSCGEPQQVDLTFSGGERIRLEDEWLLEVVHLPGHTGGNLAILDHLHHALYAGDSLHGESFPGRDDSPRLPPTYLDVDAYLNSIRTILALARGGAIKTYVGSHWPVKREEEIVAFCEDSRRFCIHAEQVVLAEIRRSESVRLSDLMGRIGPDLGNWPREGDPELRFALAGHLNFLERRGAIQSERQGEFKVYRG